MLPPSLSKADLHLLYVFSTVVEARGFSQAQSSLSVATSTISRQILDLETRLGLRLCQRGRQGFRLTEHGAVVYEAAQHLFASLDQFRSTVEGTRDEMAGTLTIALVDNWIFSTEAPIVEALKEFFATAPDVELELFSLAPDDIERAVQNEKIALGIGVFHIHKPGLEYQALDIEQVGLYCSHEHPLAQTTDADEIERILENSHLAQRAYLREDVITPRFSALKSNARAHQAEGIAVLILTGKYIGFIPESLAQIWVRQNRMVRVADGKFDTPSTIEIVQKRGVEVTRQVAAAVIFLQKNVKTQPT